MHHFFASPSDVSDETIVLTGAEAHHAAHVVRVRRDERISIADGTGRVFEVVVSEIGSAITTKILNSHEPTPMCPEITIYQSVAKGDRMDVMVQKAVEVGVRRIVPVIAERSIVRWDERKRSKAHTRWNEIARAAAKQCRAPLLTEVADVADGFDASIPLCGAFVLALEQSASARLRDVLPAARPDATAVVIGPEGGLSPDEIQHLERGGAFVASLGPRVLRTETAGPVAAALIFYAYGSLG